jgi:hypothetical protein
LHFRLAFWLFLSHLEQMSAVMFGKWNPALRFLQVLHTLGRFWHFLQIIASVLGNALSGLSSWQVLQLRLDWHFEQISAEALGKWATSLGFLQVLHLGRLWHFLQIIASVLGNAFSGLSSWQLSAAGSGKWYSALKNWQLVQVRRDRSRSAVFLHFEQTSTAMSGNVFVGLSFLQSIQVRLEPHLGCFLGLFGLDDLVEL